MKKLYVFIGVVAIALTCYGASILKSGWTTTTNPGTARTALGIGDGTILTNIGGVSGSSGGGPRVILNGALGTDDTWSGSSITNVDAGETITQWELVRVHTDGQYHLADCDAAGEFPAVGIASNSAVDNGDINVIEYGVVRNDAWSWTVGGSIYLSATAGGLTQTAPSTSGHAVQRVGFALSADSAYFNFSGEWGINE